MEREEEGRRCESIANVGWAAPSVHRSLWKRNARQRYRGRYVSSTKVVADERIAEGSRKTKILAPGPFGAGAAPYTSLEPLSRACFAPPRMHPGNVKLSARSRNACAGPAMRAVKSWKVALQVRKICAKVLASWTLIKRYEMEICGKRKREREKEREKRFKLRDEMSRNVKGWANTRPFRIFPAARISVSCFLGPRKNDHFEDSEIAIPEKWLHACNRVAANYIEGQRHFIRRYIRFALILARRM